MSTSVTALQPRVQSSANGDELIVQQRLPQAICWHEGMLLSPQHFQQNHLYWEAQFSRMMASMSRSFWGIKQLQINPSALLEGEVIVERLLAVMPDGLLIDYDYRKDEALAIKVKLPAEQNTIAVQLAVPILVPGSASQRSEIQRFGSHDGQPQVDENTGDNEMVMTRLKPMLSLRLGDRVSRRYVGLPLFRMIKPDGGSWQLDPDYAPPMLSIAADSFRINDDDTGYSRCLQNRCQSLALAIRHKARELAGLSAEEESLGHAITQRHHRWIRSMVQELSAFELLSDNPDSTPADVYESLVRMAGPMSELDPKNIPPRFPAYCHDDILPGFNQVLSYIRTQVERVNLSYTTVAFEEEQDGCFTLAYDKAWEGKDLIVELRPQGTGSKESMVRWLQASRIASSQFHKALQQRRLLGAKAQPIATDEKSGIVPAPGNVLFKIAKDKRFLRAGSKLAITVTSRKEMAGRPAAILLHMPHEQ
jgi:type VI secretion system protein ImpJ